MVKRCKSPLSLHLLLSTPVQAGATGMPGSNEHLHQKNTHYNQAYARAILLLYFPHDHLHHQKGWHRSKNEQLGKGAGSFSA